MLGRRSYQANGDTEYASSLRILVKASLNKSVGDRGTAVAKPGRRAAYDYIGRDGDNGAGEMHGK